MFGLKKGILREETKEIAHPPDKGMSVVSDGVKKNIQVKKKVERTQQMSESMEVDGSTVLGEATGQRFHLSPKCRTFGCHMFHFLLQVGDLDRECSVQWSPGWFTIVKTLPNIGNNDCKSMCCW